LVVNAVLVIDRGQHTGAKPGKAILGPGYKPATQTSSAAR